MHHHVMTPEPRVCCVYDVSSDCIQPTFVLYSTYLRLFLMTFCVFFLLLAVLLVWVQIECSLTFTRHSRWQNNSKMKTVINVMFFLLYVWSRTLILCVVWLILYASSPCTDHRQTVFVVPHERILKRRIILDWRAARYLCGNNVCKGWMGNWQAKRQKKGLLSTIKLRQTKTHQRADTNQDLGNPKNWWFDVR